MSCSIRLSGVSKAFNRPRKRAGWLLGGAPDTIQALSDVSLMIREGERVGVIGANGAGKSTLLHLVAGLSKPTTGTVSVTGRLQAVLTLGMVLHDESTGRENVYIDGEVQGRTRDEIDALAEEIIAFSELGEFIDRPVRTYSSGMKARLAFSLVAFMAPEILLIDEALSVGDVHFARKATRRMRELAQGGRIVIVVSHGMQSIVEMCTRCLWLENGRLAMDGDPSTVTEAYLARVHDADQEVLRRKFAAARRVEGRAGARIHRLESIQDSELATTVAPGRDFAIRVTGEAEALTHPGLSVRLVRIDGTLIADQAMPTDQASELRGSFTATIGARPLALGPGVYRADVSLTDNGEVAALDSVVLQVRTTDPLIGGVPMLMYPGRLAVTRVGELETAS